MQRDFTYVDDLVEAILLLMDKVPGSEPVEGDSLSPAAPHRIVNIAGGRSTELMDYIAALEKALGRTATKNFMPMQEGDLVATEASPELLRRLTGYVPTTPPSDGVPRFVEWYRSHYGV
jgi:UDP-glucuronate 4-epimerase